MKNVISFITYVVASYLINYPLLLLLKYCIFPQFIIAFGGGMPSDDGWRLFFVLSPLTMPFMFMWCLAIGFFLIVNYMTGFISI